MSARATSEVVEEIDDLSRRFGHLRRERHFREIRVAEHLRLFAPQCELLADVGRVVPVGLPLSVVRAEFGGARDISAIECLAQRAICGVLQDREIGREMQREFVAGLTVFLRRMPRGFTRIFRQAVELGFVFAQVGVGIGRVEHVVRKRLPQLSLPLLQRGEPRFIGLRQFGARQPETAQ